MSDGDMKLHGKKVDGIEVANYTDPFTGNHSREVIPIKGIRSRQKTVNKAKFDENWDRIFNKNKTKEQ